MKILSSEGFVPFDEIISQGYKETIIIYFTDGSSIECTLDHRLLMENSSWIEARDLSNYDVLYGGKVVESKQKGSIKEVFDVVNVASTNHSYYTNGTYSHNCNLLYVDETAFIEHWDEFAASVLPTISSGATTKIILTSTPNGMNHWYAICSNAGKEGTEDWNGYHLITVPWHKIPGRDENWAKERLKELNFDNDKFNQEYACEFMGSSGTLIAGWKLKELVYKTPILEKDDLYQYELPIGNNLYVLICDVSQGKGLDYSTFQVIDITTMPYKQVAVYRSNLISPSDLPEMIYRIAKLYNHAYVLIEINDMGSLVAESLHYDYEYDNIIFTESAGRAGKRVSSGFGQNVDKGIRTSPQVKSIGCSILKMMIEQNQLIIHDFHTINEISTFSKKGKSYEAESGKHDDLVMPLVLFGWFSEQQFFTDMTDIETLKQLREKREEEFDDLLVSFGFIDGIEDQEIIEEVAPKREINWLY